MENENKEVNDSKDIEEKETPETNDTTLTVDDYNKLLEEKKELEEKNAKLYARIKKESTKVAQPLAKTENGINQTEFTKLKLKVDYGITDSEAIDFIMKNGGEESLKNPYIKKTIDTMLEQKKAEAATISDDNGKSEIEKKHTLAELKSMPSSELEKILPHA
jgi:hypothetical protein